MKTAAFAIFVVFGLVAFAPPSRASLPDDRTMAREHYIKGTKAFELGLYEDAIREYMEAYKLRDEPQLLYNLGQAHRLADHSADALRFYKQYLNKLPRAANRDEVERKISELQRLVDQQKKAQSGLPPDHTIKSAPAPAESPQVVAEPAPAPAVNQSAAPAAASDQPGRSKKIAGIAVGAAGVAAVGAGIVFGVLAKSAGDGLTKTDQGMQTFDASREGTGQRDQIVEGVLIGVGAAAVVGGVVLYALGRRESQNHVVSLVPNIQSKMAALSLNVRF